MAALSGAPAPMVMVTKPASRPHPYTDGYGSVMGDFLLGVAAAGIGALFCFRGYLTMRIVIPIWGAFAGFFVGSGLVAGLGGEDFLASAAAWLLGIALAVVFGILAYAYYEVCVALALSAVLQPGVWTIVAAIGLTSWSTLARVVRAQTRFVVGIPTVTVDERVAQVAWDRAEELAPLHDDPVILLDDLGLAFVDQLQPWEGRPQAHDAAAGVPLRVHPEEEVGVGAGGIALFLPDGQRLVPKTEIHDWAAVARLVVHDRCIAFACVHKDVWVCESPISSL